MNDHYHSGFFSQGRIISGFIIILIGVLFLLNNLGTIEVGRFIADYWPILLILLGLRLVFQNTKRQLSKNHLVGDQTTFSDSPRTYYSNLFGDLDLALKSLDFQTGKISTVFGDTELDLSELQIRSGEKELKVSGVFGDIHVTAPKQVPFYLKASIVAGDIKLMGEKFSGVLVDKEFKSPDYDSATNRLKIYISHVFGDVKVC